MPYTVTQRIRAVEQPAEGYIPISKFSVKKYLQGKYFSELCRVGSGLFDAILCDKKC